MKYVILVKSKVNTTKWGKDWPSDPKIKMRPDTPPIDKIIKESIKAGDKFASVKIASLRLKDKKKGYVEGGEDSEELGDQEN